VDKQLKFLMDNGTYVGKRMYFTQKRLLFVLKGQFVELMYEPNKEEASDVKIRPFEYVVKHYADQITLPGD
jgi:hypothetical protein